MVVRVYCARIALHQFHFEIVACRGGVLDDTNALLMALCSMGSAHCALLIALCSMRSAHGALLNALNMPRAAFLCHGLRDMPRAA